LFLDLLEISSLEFLTRDQSSFFSSLLSPLSLDAVVDDLVEDGYGTTGSDVVGGDEKRTLGFLGTRGLRVEGGEARQS
jgi:hypothetical protein